MIPRSISRMFLATVLLFSAVTAQRRVHHPPWPSRQQEQASAWEVKSERVNSFSMTRQYPYGIADRLLTIIPGSDLSSPGSGTSRVPSEAERKLTKEELSYFWAYAGAKEAWWQYLRDHGKLQLLTPAADTPVPHEWFGKVVACVTTNDRFFVGRLRATPGNDQWIALQIEGAVDPVVFYLDFVKELYLIR